jgi:hypothetical protein
MKEVNAILGGKLFLTLIYQEHSAVERFNNKKEASGRMLEAHT